MPTISIRRATMQDLPAISNLSQQLFDHDGQFTDEFNMSWSRAKEGKEFIVKHVKSKKSTILLAEDGTKPIGYILMSIETVSWRKFNPVADVINLIVAPTYRGKGIGTRLLQEAKKLAIERGAKRMIVAALTADSRSLKFYEQRGFKNFNVTLLTKLT